MDIYNWQQKDWPDFTFSLESIEDELFAIMEKVGKVSGILDALPENIQMDAIVEMMVAEAIKTSEIEGEFFTRKDVMSSIKNNLGLNEKSEKVTDKKAKGIADLMIDVRNSFKVRLTKEKLFEWHKMLLPDSGDIKVGSWRDHEESMQIISGAMGKQKIHFEAPPSDRVGKEMEQFIHWFNETAPGGSKEIKKAPVRSAIAHLFFESIHPFEDGNGRIGRAIAEKALSQGIGRPILLSLSRTIEAKKSNYYALLETSQRSNEITNWIIYFVRTILEAQVEAENQIDFTLKKAKYFDRFKDDLNERQMKVIKRMMDEGPEEFQGGMNAGKYVSIAKVSKATATRDLHQLVESGALILFGNSGGRSTKYKLNL